MQRKAFLTIPSLLVLFFIPVLVQGEVQVKFPTVLVKRIADGVVSGPDAEIVFDIVNEDPNHKMEGFLACEIPSDVVVTTTRGASSGEQARYISEVFILDYAPMRRSMALSLSARTKGVRVVTCSLKYVLLSEDGWYVTPEGGYGSDKLYQDITVRRPVDFRDRVQPPTEEEGTDKIHWRRTYILISVIVAILIILHLLDKKGGRMLFPLPALLSLLIITALIIFSTAIIQTLKSKEATSPNGGFTDSCGNGQCEHYELLATCPEDCRGLGTHRYRLCTHPTSFTETNFLKVRVAGANFSLEKGELLERQSLQARPDCGSGGYGLIDCLRCYEIDEVHEPMFELQLRGQRYNPEVCSYQIVQRYFIDDTEQGCAGSEGRYVNGSVYYPYNEEAFEFTASREIQTTLQKSSNIGPSNRGACGNGVCEDYELLLTCPKDCAGLKTHSYRFCRTAGWGGVYRVRVVGTDTYLDKGTVLSATLEPLDKCGLYDCYYCYDIAEVHQPIIEIQLNSGASQVPVCSTLVKRYLVDGTDVGCTDSQWEYVGEIGRKAYFPYDARRVDAFEEARVL
ncbi:hypothetical protein J4439_00965 [Candidatus Woesearchaeota archaeon]|nr:hypothetical protein [Candidatus Woesearchaeota archaeon]